MRKGRRFPAWQSKLSTRDTLPEKLAATSAEPPKPIPRRSAARSVYSPIPYPTAWLEGRAALAGLAGANTNQLFGGVNLGARVQTPTRVAPFAGIGVFTGLSEFSVLADADGLDNDDDFFVDEPGEEEEEHGLMASVYPEIGVHAWLTSRLRVTGSAAYHLTTEGRDQDFWLLGVYFSCLTP